MILPTAPHPNPLPRGEGEGCPSPRTMISQTRTSFVIDLPEPELPPEIARYAAEPPQLGVGKPGKVGEVRMELAPSGGATRIVRCFHRVPLQVLRALYLDPLRPDMAFIYVASPTGGILQGDRLSIEVTARPGSKAHITTQAMTKVYRMEHGYAVQRVHLRTEAGSYLEYLPDPTIPFRHARYHQQIVLERAPGSTLIAADILLPGRVAHGEAFAYDAVSLVVRGQGPDGKLLFRDAMLLEPGRRSPRSPGLLGPYSVVGSLFVLSENTAVPALVDALASASTTDGDTVIGATALPNDCGAMMRVLSRTSAGAQAALRAAWATARHLYLGDEMPDLRKY